MRGHYGRPVRSHPTVTAQRRNRAPGSAVSEHHRHGTGRRDCRVDPRGCLLRRWIASAVRRLRTHRLPVLRAQHRRVGQAHAGRRIARHLRGPRTSRRCRLPRRVGVRLRRRAHRSAGAASARIHHGLDTQLGVVVVPGRICGGRGRFSARSSSWSPDSTACARRHGSAPSSASSRSPCSWCSA